MNTSKIKKGCDARNKLNLDLKHNIYFLDMVRSLDGTTKHEIQEAVQKVLDKRKVEIEKEITNLVINKKIDNVINVILLTEYDVFLYLSLAKSNQFANIALSTGIHNVSRTNNPKRVKVLK